MLPELLSPGTTVEDWIHRREIILELFRENEYGFRPSLPYQIADKIVSLSPSLDGSAVREMHCITVTTERGSVNLSMALVLPKGRTKVPTVLMLSNHDRIAGKAQAPNPALIEQALRDAPTEWVAGVKEIFAGMARSGNQTASNTLDITWDDYSGYWDVKDILASGRATAAFYASEAQPDDPERFPCMLTALFSDPAFPRPTNGWGAIGVWAFAASCIIQVLSEHPQVDPARISLAGHSRGGKAALWCAAQDNRVHAVLVNNSGCSGAALSRGKHGETVGSITAFFPHWFCPNYRSFAWREETLPFDQHMLIAAVAPRLCYITSGSEDAWSDPDAEWHSAVEGSAVWRLFGQKGLSGDPPVPGEVRYDSTIGYHRRQGGHDLTAWDWVNFMKFLDCHDG